MTTKVILGDEIGSRIHDVFAGEHFLFGYGERPRLNILSPWISNVKIKGKIPKMGGVSPQICYAFESIDLAHTILLARFLFNVEVSLVTRTPNENTYSNPTHAKNLLDFLDEIGCRIFTNDMLHSKMLLVDGLAIVGSMNLTKSALYDREEIAISIDDLENLFILASYAYDVSKESKPYGYTATENRKVTRGWLYHMFGKAAHRVFREHGFSIEDILSNIESFYSESITKLLMNDRPINVPYMRARIAYNGPYKSKHEAVCLLKKVLAREQFPKIDLTCKNVDFDFEEFMKQWELKHSEKKTRQH